MPRLKSILVGGAATVVDLGALFVMVTLLGMSPRLASVPALLLSAGTVFLGNRHFAFRATGAAVLGQAARFACVHAITLGLNALLFDVVMRVAGPVVPYWAARLAIGGLVYWVWSFPMLRRTFTSDRSAPAPRPGCTARGTRGPAALDPRT